MKILITGGCGFVGSNIAIFFKKKMKKAKIYSVDNLMRRGSTINKKRLAKYKIKNFKFNIEDRNKYEFFSHLSKEIQSWKKMHLRENEVKTIKAIEILFSEANNIEIFNKKAIYLYLRELTGLNTKQVVNSLNKFREK